MFKTRCSLAILAAIFSYQAFALTNPTNMIMGAAKYYSEKHEKGFVLKSNEDLSEWQYTENFIMPQGVVHYIPTNATCFNDVCYTVGAYSQNKKDYQAFIQTSHDQGLSWALEKIPHTKSVKSVIKGIACDETGCVATGFYDAGKRHPLIYVASDFIHWNMVTDIVGYDPTSHIGDPVQACSDGICMMATHVYDFEQDENKPLFIVSTKDKKTWSVAKVADDYARSITFSALGCKDNTCIAVGAVSDSLKMSDNHALLYVSNDHGSTWTKKTLTDDNAALNDVKCIENVCIAVGRYESQNMHNQTLIAVSKDSGQSWQIKNYKIDQVPWLDIETLDCNNNFCVALGVSYSSYPAQFVPYVSVDKGDNWVEMQAEGVPKGNFGFTGLKCSSKKCFYTIEDGSVKIKSPIIVTSDESGKKWGVTSKLIDIPDGLNYMFVDALL